MLMRSQKANRRPGRRRHPVSLGLEGLEDRTLLSSTTALDPDPAPSDFVAPHVPGEVLVRFRLGAGEAARAEARGLAGGTLAERIPTAAAKAGRAGNLERIALSKGVDVQDALRRLSKNP